MTPSNLSGQVAAIATESMALRKGAAITAIPDLGSLKVALVHEWFDTYAGSERVVEQILQCFPQAAIFAIVDFMPASERGFFGGRSLVVGSVRIWV
jgi:hypothetical protein